MLKEFKQLKALYPDRILIASIMEEYNKAAWEELIDRVEETGIVRYLYLVFYVSSCIFLLKVLASFFFPALFYRMQ